jgi:hypothetical protein
LIAAGAAALALASSAGAVIHLVSLTSPVKAGSDATVTARVLPRGVRCSITVTYKSGPSHASGLSPRRPSRTGRVTWTWEVGPSTTSGRWPIVVSCGSAGTLHTASRSAATEAARIRRRRRPLSAERFCLAAGRRRVGAARRAS